MSVSSFWAEVHTKQRPQTFWYLCSYCGIWLWWNPAAVPDRSLWYIPRMEGELVLSLVEMEWSICELTSPLERGWCRNEISLPRWCWLTAAQILNDQIYWEWQSAVQLYLGNLVLFSPQKTPAHHLCLTTVFLCDVWEVPHSVSWETHGDHKMVSDPVIAQLVFLTCSVNGSLENTSFVTFFPPSMFPG